MAQLNIKDEEAQEMARRLAKRTGESVTRAVKIALQERLARIERPSDRVAAALAIGRDIRDRLEEPLRSVDPGDLFYEPDTGLPK